MAAEVPVKDVLCEAMEYLSKLGSNLRTRTENLKEKKIRKDKLNNAIALQKAANKVLLICELSKKSLENVETGVRKILQRVDVSQAPLDGGNSSNTEKKSNNLEKPSSFSFVYKSKKLRIRKKVNLKHFMSVKVMANKMPISMLKKYPVNYDCKLYRLRKKWDQRKSNSSLDNTKSIEKDKDNFSQCDHTVSSAKNKSDDENDNEVPGDEQVSKHQARDRTKSRSSSNKARDTSTQNIEKRSEESRKISKHRSSNGSDAKENESKSIKNKLLSDSDDDTDIKDSLKRTKKTKNTIIESSEEEGNNDTHSTAKNNDTSKETVKDVNMDCNNLPKEIQNDININSPPPLEAVNHQNKKHGSTQPEQEKENTNHNNDSKNDSIQEPESKKRKLNESNTPTEAVTNNEVVNESKSKQKKLSEGNTATDTVTNNKVVKEPKSKQKKLSDGNIATDTVTNNEVVTLESSDDEPSNDDTDRAKTPEDNGHKPMIKLVSLSKLLKPNVKAKDVLGHTPKVQQNNKPKIDKKSETRTRNWLEEESYWVQKRKEVKAFKPKKFTINIARLPKLSINYLQKHKLKKVIKNGKIVYEINDGKEKNPPQNRSDSDSEIQTETNKIKDALLNDSESDTFGNDNDSSSGKDKNTRETETAKDSLLNDSDSNSSQIKAAKENEKSKRKRIIASDSDKSDHENNSQNKKTKENDNQNGSGNEEDTQNKNEHENGTRNESDDENDSRNKSDNENNTRKKSDSENNTQNKSDNENDTQNKSDKGYKSDSSKEQEVQKTPEKCVTPVEEEQAKESLLMNSSDDKTNTPLKQRKVVKPDTPQSKKKSMRESIRAKKMLLTYSSSSETDDEQLRNVLRNIKNSLLNDISDDDESKKPSKEDSDAKCNSSVKDILEQVKKKMSCNSDSEGSKGNNLGKKDSSNKNKMVRSKSKPGNCSSQNSDTVDSNDKEIDGLSNLKSLNKVRRRNADDQNDSDRTQEATMRSKASSTVVNTGLIDGEILNAESDSDEASGDDNEVGGEDDEEVMPSVSFNGADVIEHLAKDDLLGESDSSSTQNENNSENNKEDSDEDEKVNSKRRKANAISSDSEAGSSRKKEQNVRVSDFEDSEDDTSESTKKSKRKKKKGSESDASGTSSNEGGGKKKRRRIKQIDSDGSGSETENEGRNKHGRKNIRKVMGKNQLEEATKKAAREEKERIARIAERQKLYNNLEFDESGKPDEVVLEKVVLDFDSETKEPLIEVDRGLVKKLKPHQANGIKFMWNACFESVKRIKKDKGSGCILAHCMGLGKTLQVVTLTHTLLTHGDLTKVNRVLVVCPLSTVLNWVNEFKMWLKYADADYEVDVYELSRFKQNSERAFQLSQWFEHGGVCVLGYEMFRNLSADNTKKFKKKMLKHFQEALVDPGPDLVVCDEGHLLKNEKTSLSQSMNRVKTLRRIVLTGTPLQNNLKEYYCMVQFVKPNLLGKYNEYLNRFVNPITNGQYTDSTEHDIKIMKRRSHVLHKMLDGAVQRRDYGVLAPFLPPKHEYVLFITLTDVQRKLYQFYLENYSRRPLAGKSSGFLFPDFQSLQRIWTHPLVLKYNSERYEIMQQKKREREEEDSEGSLVDFIDDDSTPEETSEEEMSDDLSDLSDDSRKKSKKKKNAKKSKAKESKASATATRRGTRANPREQEEEDEVDDVMEVKNDNPTEWWIKMVTDDEIEDMRNSHKLILLFDILRQCETIGDKLLVFSQSLYSLDLIEHFLGKVDEATQEGRVDEKLAGHVGSWSPGVDYFRLDGSTSCENRSIWCKNFNREDNPRARLFLISTRAGGLGINLVAANRVVIFDVSWNPSHDVQSIFRVYRFGQKKPCYVYRFLAMGTMEEKIYERQVTKQAISKRVIDEQQIDRHYAENDLAELYKFEPHPPQPRPLPPLPKDRLFAEMLKEHEAQIYKYHEHDSLLENKEEETLSEEERKAAWEDFENEKNRPPPAPFPSPWPMHNGMVPGLLAQQQQQLAYAALAAMLRKDMPNINDNQIRDMLPLIYNANPGLMQKMSEVYKYAQPGMMNPMMTPNVMNSASGAMSGMGGTSSLQYEPPWQRQQQMRLQQIMQQQNQMGAKYYAGGLGSRDPAAMALQQQRAREIMMSGGGSTTGAGRPRGRPPMQPRLPPATTGDVVNLDSD